MDLLSPSSTTNSPLIPIFGDHVQDLLGINALQVNHTNIITVNSIADVVDNFNSGVTTLRDAINQANADTGSDLIVFDQSLFSSQQTITLSLGELDISHSLDIIAPRDSLTGGDLVTVSGNNASRVFEIGTGTTVTLSGLIVADGNVTGDNGGGIKNSGILTLDNDTISGNSATGDGGGIYSGNNGISTINNSTISGNSATGNGGGFYSGNNGISTINNSIISGNSATGNGGDIYVVGGAVNISNSFNNALNSAPGASIAISAGQLKPSIVNISNSFNNSLNNDPGALIAINLGQSKSSIVNISDSFNNSLNNDSGASITINAGQSKLSTVNVSNSFDNSLNNDTDALIAINL